MDYQIREIRGSEYPLLSDFLYEAIFDPEGMEKPPKSIIRQPELQVYIADFGKADDWCFVTSCWIPMSPVRCLAEKIRWQYILRFLLTEIPSLSILMKALWLMRRSMPPCED